MQEPVFIQVAHVAQRDQPVALHGRAGFGPVDVGEVGQGALAHIDQADLPRRQRIAVLVQDADLRIGQRAARRAWMAQPARGIGEGGVARFARAIGLGDEGPEPVDHGLLEGNGAGRAGRRDLAQRGQVMPRARFGRQCQQALVHGRHQVGVRDLVAREQFQRALRVEARLQHQRCAQVAEVREVGHGRTVVDRRGQVGGDVRAGAVDDVGDPLQPPLHGSALFGRAGNAAHALGLAGGAGGIGNRAMRGAGARRHGRQARPEIRPVMRLRAACRRAGARDQDDADAFGDALAHLVEQVRVDNHRASAAVGQDMVGFERLEVPVDRCQVQASLAAGQHERHVLRTVAQHGGDGVALLAVQIVQPSENALDLPLHPVGRKRSPVKP